MASRDFNDDEDWEQIDSYSQADDDFHMIQTDKPERSEGLKQSEAANLNDYTTGFDASTGRASSRSSTPHSQRDAADDKMAVVKRDSSPLQLPHRSRHPPQRQQQQLTTTSSTSSVSYTTWNPSFHSTQTRATPATPATPPTRPAVDWRTWTPRHQQVQRPNNNNGHTYGAIYAAGNATVLMGNVGLSNGNARNHSYGPVFTTDQASVYVGDMTSEEAAKVFQRSRDQRRGG